MYALVNFSGKQIKIEEGKDVRVPFIKENIGSKVTLEDVLLFDDGKKKQIGSPYIKSLSFNAKVVSHNKDSKIIVYKKKRRKGYEKKNGHQQQYTVINVAKMSNTKKTKKAVATTKKTAAVKTKKTTAKSKKTQKKTTKKTASQAKK